MSVAIKPPICPHCHVAVEWFNSVRTPHTTDTLTHFFRCPHCHLVQELSMRQTESSALPSDLPQSSTAKNKTAHDHD
ncbi:MAG TPA: hypothetical protein VFP60_18250 [Pseudolabrys sp.]|nr:hypothetical protein [Pseudolabrys sp.]